MWYQPWTAGSVVAVVSTHGNRGLEEGKKQEEQHAKKGKMEKMEQIIYEQAFKEHCVTSNNKMKGKKHLKWVALFRRHASSSKAMSLRKTVNLSYFFFSRTLPEQLLVVAKSGEHEMGRTPTPTLLLISTKTEAQEQHKELTLGIQIICIQTLPASNPPTPASKSRHPPPGGGRECFNFFSSSTQCRALPSILKPLSPGHIYSWQMKRIS